MIFTFFTRTMGVNNLLRVKFNDCIIANLGKSIYNLNNLDGATVYVDAHNIIYRHMLAMTHIKRLSANGKTTVHINAVIVLANKLHMAGIKQIWVFDYGRNPRKERELAQRQERRRKATKEKYKFIITQTIIDEIKELLTMLGISYIVAEQGCEAEQVAAFLSVSEANSYVLSNDTDVLLFGGNLLKRTNDTREVYEIYYIKEILDSLEISYDQFILLCYALGTDFNTKIKGLGPNTILQKIKEGKVIPSEDYDDFHEYICTDFCTVDMVNSEKNLDALVEFLRERNFNDRRINNFVINFKFGSNFINEKKN